MSNKGSDSRIKRRQESSPTFSKAQLQSYRQCLKCDRTHSLKSKGHQLSIDSLAQSEVASPSYEKRGQELSPKHDHLTKTLSRKASLQQVPSNYRQTHEQSKRAKDFDLPIRMRRGSKKSINSALDESWQKVRERQNERAPLTLADLNNANVFNERLLRYGGQDWILHPERCRKEKHELKQQRRILKELTIYYESQVLKLNQQIKQLQNSLEGSERRCHDFRFQERAIKESQLKEMVKKMASCEELRDCQVRDRRKLTKDLEAAQQQISNLTTSKQKLVVLMEAAQAKNTELVEKHSVLKGEHAQMTYQISELQGRLIQKISEGQSMISQRAKLKDKLYKSEQECQSLHSQLQILTAENRTLLHHGSKLSHLEDQIQKLKASLSEHNSHLSEREAEWRGKEELWRQKEEWWRQRNDAECVKEQELTTRQQEFRLREQDLKVRLLKTEKRQAQLEQELSVLRQQKQGLVHSAKTQLLDFSQRLQSLRSLEIENERLMEAVRVTVHERDSLIQERQNYQRRREEWTREKGRLQKEIERLEGGMVNLTEQTNSLKRQEVRLRVEARGERIELERWRELGRRLGINWGKDFSGVGRRPK